MEKSEVVSQKDEKIKNSEAGDREKLRNEDEELRQRIEKVKRERR